MKNTEKPLKITKNKHSTENMTLWNLVHLSPERKNWNRRGLGDSILTSKWKSQSYLFSWTIAKIPKTVNQNFLKSLSPPFPTIYILCFCKKIARPKNFLNRSGQLCATFLAEQLCATFFPPPSFFKNRLPRALFYFGGQGGEYYKQVKWLGHFYKNGSISNRIEGDATKMKWHGVSRPKLDFSLYILSLILAKFSVFHFFILWF